MARKASVICGLALAAVGLLAASHIATHRSVGLTAGPGRVATVLEPIEDFRTAESATYVLLSPTGKFAVAITKDNHIDAWSIATRRQLIAGVHDGSSPGKRSFASPAFSPDGKTFVVLDYQNADGSTDAWRPADGQQPLLPIAVGSDPLTLGPHNLIAKVNVGQIFLYDIANGYSEGVFSIPSSGGRSFSSVVFSPSGYLVAGDNGKGRIYLWDIARKRVIAALTVEKLFNDTWESNPNSGPVADTISFSPDSKIVAVGSDSGIVRVWNVATGRDIATFSINGDDPYAAAALPVRTLIFSPDGRTVVTNYGPGVLAAWDVTSGSRVGTIRLRGGVFEAAAFARTGKLIVATENRSPAGYQIEIWSTTGSLAGSPTVTPTA